MYNTSSGRKGYRGFTHNKNEIETHKERFELQKKGKACYLGAIINDCVIGFVLISMDNKKDVMPYTNNNKCADMIDLFVANRSGEMVLKHV